MDKMSPAILLFFLFCAQVIHCWRLSYERSNCLTPLHLLSWAVVFVRGRRTLGCDQHERSWLALHISRAAAVRHFRLPPAYSSIVFSKAKDGTNLPVL